MSGQKDSRVVFLCIFVVILSFFLVVLCFFMVFLCLFVSICSLYSVYVFKILLKTFSGDEKIKRPKLTIQKLQPAMTSFSF